MIKKIIIYTLIYAAILLAVTLNTSSFGGSFILITIFSSLIFSGLIIREVYLGYFVGFKPKNNQITYQALGEPNENLKKISKTPFLFGLEKKLVSEDDFYFDNENFYAVNGNQGKAEFKLSDITELSRTSAIINNSPIWRVKIKSGNAEELVFNFTHNYSIWNKNFVAFYEKIKAINPSAVKSNWSLWRM